LRQVPADHVLAHAPRNSAASALHTPRVGAGEVGAGDQRLDLRVSRRSAAAAALRHFPLGRPGSQPGPRHGDLHRPEGAGQRRVPMPVPMPRPSAALVAPAPQRRVELLLDQLSMKAADPLRSPASIGRTRPPRRTAPLGRPLVLSSSMAWSPPALERRSWLVEQAGDYAAPSSTTSATAPPNGADPLWRTLTLARAVALEGVAAKVTAPEPSAPPLERGAGGEVQLRENGDDPWPKREVARATRASPDLLDAEASQERLALAREAGALTLALDAAEGMGAASPAERMIAHQMAVAHAMAMRLAAKSEAFAARRFLTYQPRRRTRRRRRSGNTWRASRRRAWRPPRRG
jgi:hypothetical protein